MWLKDKQPSFSSTLTSTVIDDARLFIDFVCYRLRQNCQKVFSRKTEPESPPGRRCLFAWFISTATLLSRVDGNAVLVRNIIHNINPIGKQTIEIACRLGDVSIVLNRMLILDLTPSNGILLMKIEYQMMMAEHENALNEIQTLASFLICSWLLFGLVWFVSD